MGSHGNVGKSRDFFEARSPVRNSFLKPDQNDVEPWTLCG